MESCKDMSISVLKEMLINYNNSRLFAEYKLQHLMPGDPNSEKEIAEFKDMRNRITAKILRLSRCINWITSLETDCNDQ